VKVYIEWDGGRKGKKYWSSDAMLQIWSFYWIYKSQKHLFSDMMFCKDFFSLAVSKKEFFFLEKISVGILNQ